MPDIHHPDTTARDTAEQIMWAALATIDINIVVSHLTKTAGLHGCAANPGDWIVRGEHGGFHVSRAATRPPISPQRLAELHAAIHVGDRIRVACGPNSSPSFDGREWTVVSVGEPFDGMPLVNFELWAEFRTGNSVGYSAFDLYEVQIISFVKAAA